MSCRCFSRECIRDAYITRMLHLHQGLHKGIRWLQPEQEYGRDTFGTTTSSFGFGSSNIFWSTFLFFGLLHVHQAALSQDEVPPTQP